MLIVQTSQSGMKIPADMRPKQFVAPNMMDTKRNSKTVNNLQEKSMKNIVVMKEQKIMNTISENVKQVRIQDSCIMRLLRRILML